MAEGKVSAYVLARGAVNELLGPIQELWRHEALRRVPILFNLTDAQLLQLAKCMAPRSLAAGDIVFRQGDAGAEPPSAWCLVMFGHPDNASRSSHLYDAMQRLVPALLCLRVRGRTHLCPVQPLTGGVQWSRQQDSAA